MAVDKYQSRGRQLPKGKVFDRHGGHAVPRRFKNRFEGQFGDRGHIGEPPVFIVQSGKASLREADNARFAQGENPGRLFGLFLELLEFLQQRFGVLSSSVRYHVFLTDRCLASISLSPTRSDKGRWG